MPAVRHAFADESRRGQTYLIAAAVVDPSQLAPLRKLMRSLLVPGQSELHCKKEGPQRRRLIVSELVRSGATVQVYAAAVARDAERARQRCLARLTVDLLDANAKRLLLDSRRERDALDSQTIRSALGGRPSETELTYEHVDSTAEPLLWLADVAAWAYGAGGDWRRRIEPALAAVVEVDRAPDSAKPGRRPSGR